MHHIIVTELIKSEVTLRETSSQPLQLTGPFRSLWQKVTAMIAERREAVNLGGRRPTGSCQTTCVGKCAC